MFTRYSHSVLPSLISTQTSASCVCGPTTTVLFSPCPYTTSPTRVHVYNRPFITIGLDIPVTFSFFQATFSPENGSNFSGRFASREIPLCSGPRHCDQSFPNETGATAAPNT